MRKAQLYNEKMDNSKTHIKTRSRGEVVFSKTKIAKTKLLNYLKLKIHSIYLPDSGH